MGASSSTIQIVTVTLESVRLRVLMISRQKPQIADELMPMIWPGVAASSPGRSTLKAQANPIRQADQPRQPHRSVRHTNVRRKEGRQVEKKWERPRKHEG